MPTTTRRFLNLNGIYAAIATPFNSNGEVVFSGFSQLLEWQKQSGIEGVVVAGTNGEGTSLSVDERKKLLETAIGARVGLNVIAGTGAASIEDAISLTVHAAEVGAEAVLVLPPFFFKQPSVEGLIQYFQKVLDSANIPVLLYHIPQFSMVPITSGIIDALLPHPNLAGLKDSTGVWESTAAFVRDFPELAVFAGNDHLTQRITAVGGAGSISGTANSFPELIARVRNLYTTGDRAGSTEAQNQLDMVMNVLAAFPPFAVNKAVMALRGLPAYSVRPPMRDLNADEARELAGKLVNYL